MTFYSVMSLMYECFQVFDKMEKVNGNKISQIGTCVNITNIVKSQLSWCAQILGAGKLPRKLFRQLYFPAEYFVFLLSSQSIDLSNLSTCLYVLHVPKKTLYYIFLLLIKTRVNKPANKTNNYFWLQNMRCTNTRNNEK